MAFAIAFLMIDDYLPVDESEKTTDERVESAMQVVEGGTASTEEIIRPACWKTIMSPTGGNTAGRICANPVVKTISSVINPQISL